MDFYNVSVISMALFILQANLQQKSTSNVNDVDSDHSSAYEDSVHMLDSPSYTLEEEHGNDKDTWPRECSEYYMRTDYWE